MHARWTPTLVFAGLSCLLLALYGTEICPYIEGLGRGAFFAILLGAFAVALGARELVRARLVAGDAPDLVDQDWPWHTLLLNVGTWVLAGVLLSGYDLLVLGYPLGSGLKAGLGCLTLGLFAGTWLALDNERLLIERVRSAGGQLRMERGRFFSVTTKFLVFLTLALLLIVVVLMLLLAKDLSDLENARGVGAQAELGLKPVFLELLFVFGVLTLGCLAVGRRYAQNLALVLSSQLDVLERVADGRYDHEVPVVSHDELSLIARHTNGMIAGLRERERVRGAFGKLLSPTVAEQLLSEEGGLDRGGREVEVAVLFTDIRGWTPLSEALQPKELVGLLNEYFTLVVGAIHGARGCLDKFIGDAAMAVFGLDGTLNPCDDAVRAARNIQRTLAPFNAALLERGLPRIQTGIGIAYGPVVAGNIGSEDRLEYTVIGDTVNVAARLEGLTKELPTRVALTVEVAQRCAPSTRTDLRGLGVRRVKGKSEGVEVWGLDPAAWGEDSLPASAEDEVAPTEIG